MSPLSRLLETKLIQYALGSSVWGSVSIVVIFILDYQGMNPYIANFTGYMIGLVLAFCIQKHVIFTQSSNTLHKQITFFIVIFLCAYSMNLVVLWSLLQLNVWSYVAHIAGAGAYALISYLSSRYIVFR